MTISISCARCGKDLTDAASRECGVGPICRNLDNAILATYIPADVSAARAALAQVPATLVAKTKHIAALHDRVRDALHDVDAPSCTDWRTTIKRIEWLVSRTGGRCGQGARAFAAVGAALGYVGLASVWLDQAAKGAAIIWVQLGRTTAGWNGRKGINEQGAFLFVSGPRNKAANAATKAIEGRRFHTGAAHVAHRRDPKKAKSEPAAWSVPAAQFDAFLSMVQAHYPSHRILDAATGDVVSAVDTDGPADWKAFRTIARKAYRKANPKGTPRADTKPAPTCRIEDATDNVFVFAPKNGAFIADLKRLPWKSRKWSREYNCWIVGAVFRETVETLIAKHYGADALGGAA